MSPLLQESEAVYQLIESASAKLGRARPALTAAPNVLSYFERSIFFALLGLIALTAIPYGTVEPWWEALFECAVFVLTALWMIEGLMTGSCHLYNRSLFVPLLVLVAFSFLQALPLWVEPSASTAAGGSVWRSISADPFETRLTALKILALTLALFLLLRYTSSRRRLRALVHTVIGVAVTSALFGIVRQTTQHGATGFVLPYLQPGSGYGQFINRNHFAFMMEMALGLVLGLMIGGGVGREKMLVYLTALLLLWSALVLSNSRGGILSMLGQVLFIALLYTAVRPAQQMGRGRNESPDRVWQIANSLVMRVALCVCLVAGIGAGVVWIGGDSLAQKIESSHNELGQANITETKGGRRVDIWQATWRMISANMVAGAGMGGYWAAIPKYHDASGAITPQQAHNDYLELFASGGLVGLAIGGWFCGALIIAARRKILSAVDSFERAACFGALVGLFGVAIHSFFDFGLHITANGLLFVALVVIATRDVGPAQMAGQRGGLIPHGSSTMLDHGL